MSKINKGNKLWHKAKAVRFTIDPDIFQVETQGGEVQWALSARSAVQKEKALVVTVTSKCVGHN